MKKMLKYLLTFVIILNAFAVKAQIKADSSVSYDYDFRIVHQHSNRVYAELYPNPLIGNVLKIKSSNIIKSVEIKNIIGQCILSEENKFAVHDDMVLTIPKNEPGVYSAKITFEDNNFIIKKLIIR